MARLTMYRGDYREYTATVTTTYDPDAEVHFAVKTKSDVDPIDATDDDALLKIDVTSANAVNNGDGTVTYTIIIDGSLTTGKTPGKYIAEIEYVDGDGKHTTYPQLTFELKGDVNQRV